MQRILLVISLFIVCTAGKSQSKFEPSLLYGTWQFDKLTNQSGAAIDIAISVADTIPLYFNTLVFDTKTVKLKANGGAWIRNYQLHSSRLEIDKGGTLANIYFIESILKNTMLIRFNIGSAKKPSWIYIYYKKTKS